MPDRVSLSNPDAEFALVGGLMAAPHKLRIMADLIQPDWFTDLSARAFFQAAVKAQEAGGEVSREAILGNLPENVSSNDPALVLRLYVELINRAVTENALPGVMALVRDRWARRVLSGIGKFVEGQIDLSSSDPFALTAEMLATIDMVQAARKELMAGSLSDGAERLIDDLEANRSVRSFTTGLNALDKIIGRYRAGQLYVVAARPAMGKSTFAVSTLLRTAQQRHGIMFFSLEMTEEEVAARCMSGILGHQFAPPYQAIIHRNLLPGHMKELKDAAEKVRRLPFHFDYSPNLTLRDIASRARAKRAELEAAGLRLDVIVVDHLTIIAPSDRYKGNPVMEVSQNIDGLRVLAKELDVAVIALCQLSRDVEKRDDKRPTLSDLRWTGEIEQAAHVVAFLYRDAYYLQNDPAADPFRVNEAKYEMDVLVRKNRQGETGDIRLACDMAHSFVGDPS